MNAPAVRKLLVTEVKKLGSQKKFADAHGMSLQLLNDTINGRRVPAGKILKALGLVEVIDYRKANA